MQTYVPHANAYITMKYTKVKYSVLYVFSDELHKETGAESVGCSLQW